MTLRSIAFTFLSLECAYAKPFKLAPIESVIPLPADDASEFKHLFPPHSVTILRLGLNR